MKAQELNGTHLGQRITVTEGSNSVTGELSRIDHEGNIVTERTYMQPERAELGRTWVRLEFLGAMRTTVTPRAEVEVHQPVERF